MRTLSRFEPPRHLDPRTEHLPDRFHLTMRITVMTQPATALRSPPGSSADEVAAELHRLTWFLWHGNIVRSLHTIDDLAVDLDGADAGVEHTTLAVAVGELGRSVLANASAVPTDGERYRAGEAISTSFVESTVNQVDPVA